MSLLASAIVSGVVFVEKRCSGILIFVGIVGSASGNVTGSIDRVEWISRWSRIRRSRCGLHKVEKTDRIEILERKTKILVEPMALTRN